VYNKKSGIEFVAQLAAKDYIRRGLDCDVKKYAHNYLLRYTEGAMLNEKTYSKFYELVGKELKEAYKS